MSDELKPLSRKHQRVLDEYLICFNQWRSYKVAFPKVTDESARTLSSILFADVNFLAHLSERLNEVHMSADEALKLVTDIARGDVAELMDISSVGFNLDMAEAKRRGLTRLIKKVKQKTITKIGKKASDEDTEIHELEIELYDAQAAQRDLLKIHGKFLERLDLSNTDGSLKPEKGIDDERFTRAISTLADALREVVPGKDSK